MLDDRVAGSSGHVWRGTHDGDSLARAIDQSVDVVDHDPRWRGVFEAERARLFELFPAVLIEVAHIGSTSVDGVRAKPIVDLMAGVTSMAPAVALLDPLCNHGYAVSDDLNHVLIDRQFLMRHADGRRTHHLHVVVHESQAWHDRVAFCALLRGDAELRGRYERLKMDLAARHAAHRDAYTEGKSAFIQAAIRRCRATFANRPLR